MAAASGPASASDDLAWKAIAARDADADGEFVFAVRTTGIFCRPSCPAKRPKRENVELFPSAEIASAAGYRACKRCRPAEAARTLGEKRVTAAAKILDERAGERIQLDELAARVKLSAFHLQREFKRVFGMSPRAYQSAVRVHRLKSALSSGAAVSAAGYEAGFGSSRGLYEGAVRSLGMTPGQYRRGGIGASIHYGFTGSAIGTILLAATDKGVCAVYVGSDPRVLERELRDEFPAAALTRTKGRDAEMKLWLKGAAELAAGRSAPPVPLDVRGSAFQQKVWDALSRIPAGETRSYSAIAKSIGAEGASRAVGSACGRNPVSLLVPCHRALRKGGEPGGYRWGVSRKLQLLENERRAAGARGRKRP